MTHGLHVIQDPRQMTAFSGLILPDVVSRLEEPCIVLVGAIEGNVPVGAAVMEIEPGRAALLSIGVAEDRRRLGIGSALLRQCVRVLRRTSIQSLYAVLPSDVIEAEALFLSFGLTTSASSGVYYSFPLETAFRSENLNGAVKSVISLNRVSQVLFRGYIQKVFTSDPTVGKKEYFDPDVSYVYMENDTITACLLAECTDTISISWLSSQSKGQMAPVYLMRAAMTAAKKKFPPETVVDFTVYEPEVVRFVDKLLGETVKKYPIRQWNLTDHRFRLIDTTPTGWEEDNYV